MFCHNCGSPVPDGSRFCENCGTRLEDCVVEQRKTEYKPNPFAKPESVSSSFAYNYGEGRNLGSVQIVGIVAVLLSLLAVLSNVGGRISGIRLIELIWNSLNSSSIPLYGDEKVACILLLISHLGIILFCIVGFIFFHAG